MSGSLAINDPKFVPFYEYVLKNISYTGYFTVISICLCTDCDFEENFQVHFVTSFLVFSTTLADSNFLQAVILHIKKWSRWHFTFINHYIKKKNTLTVSIQKEVFLFVSTFFLCKMKNEHNAITKMNMNFLHFWHKLVNTLFFFLHKSTMYSIFKPTYSTKTVKILVIPSILFVEYLIINLVGPSIIKYWRFYLFDQHQISYSHKILVIQQNQLWICPYTVLHFIQRTGEPTNKSIIEHMTKTRTFRMPKNQEFFKHCLVIPPKVKEVKLSSQ